MSTSTPLPRVPRRRALALACLGALALGCRSARNPDPRDPGPWLLTTQPTQARVSIPALGLDLWSPCRLPEGVTLETEIEVTKEGYHPFRGVLGDLPRLAANSFELVLTR